MTKLSGLSFRTKLMVLLTFTSVLTIVLAASATTAFDYFWSKDEAVNSVQTLAQVTASNSAAAIVFNDPEAATDILSALEAVPGIITARIYDMEGNVFATYGQEHDHFDLTSGDVDTEFAFDEAGYLEMSHVIMLDGERIGVINLHYDMRLVEERLFSEILVIGFCAIFATLVALLLAMNLQRTLTRPILELEKTAREVSQTQDYALRATQYSNDELGTLTDKFNEMLSQVQARDDELAKSQDHLEEQVIQRTKELETAKGQAEAAAASLALSEDRIRSILRQAPDGIITFDSKGIISLSNPAAERIFNCTQDDFQRININDLVTDAYHVNEEGVILCLNNAEENRNLGTYAEIIGNRLDGSTVPIRLAISPSKLSGADMFTASIRDITDQKQAEQEKEDLNRQLMEESRRSGMAEIATGVLHNVGNVLNSVNVSVNLINDRLSKSKVQSLLKAAEMVRNHLDDLPQFIQNDEHGKHLPEFIVQVAEHLDNEHKDLAEELKNLFDRTLHVQEIISTQQSYASAGGMVETISLKDVVQDALRINEAGLKRHQIHLTVECEDIPKLSIDKHKLLQILVNLISNAKYAADHNKSECRIAIRAHASGVHSEFVVIEVADNGVGISPENLLRIFNHGFTTRHDGHGFGLHNAALSAHELGGSLHAYSDGPGRGATFTLKIPINHHSQNEEAEHEHTM